LGLGGIGEERVHELGAVGDFEQRAFHILHCKKKKEKKEHEGQTVADSVSSGFKLEYPGRPSKMMLTI